MYVLVSSPCQCSEHPADGTAERADFCRKALGLEVKVDDGEKSDAVADLDEHERQHRDPAVGSSELRMVLILKKER